MLGTWTFTVEGMPPHPQCGASIQNGVMDVERKITARAYRAKVRSEATYEKCQGTGVALSSATVRIKDGNLITVDYDEDGWEMDRLRLVDGVMTGNNGKGVSTRWVRDDGSTSESGLTEEQLAALDALMREIRPEVVDTLRESYFEMIWKALERVGDLPRDEAKQVTGIMIERMTDCMVDEFDELARNQLAPAQDMLVQDQAVLMFDPEAEEFIGSECVENAALNAGIRLR